jgi:hypothetical protein
MEHGMIDDSNPETASPLIKKYYALRAYLGINLIDLDKMYTETPRILQDAVELAAEADFDEMVARHTYDVIKAEASDRIRSVLVAGKEPSEARIDKLIPLEQDVQNARVVLNKAQRDAQVCTGLYRSLDMQSRLLGKASDMINSGFISPSAAYDERRRELRKARLEAEARNPLEMERPLGRPTS